MNMMMYLNHLVFIAPGLIEIIFVGLSTVRVFGDKMIMKDVDRNLCTVFIIIREESFLINF